MNLSLENRKVASLFQINGLHGAQAGEFNREFGLQQLPQSGGSAIAQDAALMWNGPGMWVIESETLGPEAVASKLRRVFENTDATAVDLSSSRTVIRASGAQAGHLIRKGSPANIGAMADCSVVSTVIGHFSVMIHHHDAVFDMYVMQTFGADFWHWCRHNAREFGFTG